MSHCVILLFFLLLTLVLVQSQLQCDILGICEVIKIVPLRSAVIFIRIAYIG